MENVNQEAIASEIDNTNTDWRTQIKEHKHHKTDRSDMDWSMRVKAQTVGKRESKQSAHSQMRATDDKDILF
jgi:hypothetical protein